MLTPRPPFHAEGNASLQSIAAFAGKIPGGIETAAELYQALGNSCRVRGDLEGAVRTRKILLDTVNLGPKQRASTLLELGRDYVGAGFLDRAKLAFEEAGLHGADSDELNLEIARLAAQTNDFSLAAAAYGKLGNKAAQAHYLVRQGREAATSDNPEPKSRGIRNALTVHPGSVEAWLEKLCLLYGQKSTDELARNVPKAMYAVLPRLRFVLLEGLIQYAGSEGVRQGTPLFDKSCARALDETLTGLTPDVLVAHYAGTILLKAGMTEKGRTWLEKSLLLEPDFWPARLELLKINAPNQTLSPEFQVQLDYFIRESITVKRFVCRNCGLKREQLFFICPRCRSWHSISARKSLSE
jgi:lipopolysaccharide biosynthesis regulator YciM